MTLRDGERPLGTSKGIAIEPFDVAVSAVADRQPVSKLPVRHAIPRAVVYVVPLRPGPEPGWRRRAVEHGRLSTFWTRSSHHTPGFVPDVFTPTKSSNG